MTVETRYVVVRDNMEVKIFVNKKEADEYDKLLDSADLINELLIEGPIELTEQQAEEISFYLAKNKERILNAFQIKKSFTSSKAK
jgi:uncharacterized protein